MVMEEENQSPQDSKNSTKKTGIVQDAGNLECLISPRFRSVAAMAGWDEEALLLASLVVEDTPDRESKHKKRANSQFKSPPISSRTKRRAQRRSPASVPVVALNLDEEDTVREDHNAKKFDPKSDGVGKKKKQKEEEAGDTFPAQVSSSVSCSGPILPCMDQLKEELSCAICLEICFEPSTTPCGHSFCKKCLRSAADKCGKRCPKCRQLISNGRSCTVNTVLWNTIQLLFPQEVSARKAASAITRCEEAEHQSPGNCSHYNTRSRGSPLSNVMGRDANTRRLRRGVQIQAENDALAFMALRDYNNTQSGSNSISAMMGREASVRRRNVPSQDGDAALAFRLQREEFMEVFRGTTTHEQPRSSLSSARENLRAMASRAVNLRIRRRAI